MLHECNHCRKKADDLKRCAACSLVWYCNSECQKSNWPVHLVDCNLGRPITTAERLVACVHTSNSPDDETLRDYGFPVNPSNEDLDMRLQVYAMLIIELQVKAKTIHQWMKEGNLDSMMRKTFDTRLTPDQRLQEPYLWFCNHQSTFNRHANLLSSDMDTDSTLRRAWMFIGRSPLDSDEFIHTSIRNFTLDRRTCFLFIAFLMEGLIPNPVIESDRAVTGWIEFGFCACAGPNEESDLAFRYQALLQRASYDAFCRAYTSSTLPKLFADSGLAISQRFILNVLGSRNYKSVWYLKKYVFGAAEADAPKAPVDRIYGFSNCRNMSETIALRNAYKQVFLRSDADPLSLDAAYLRGDLFEYVGKIARLKPPQLFKRLMKSP